MAVQLNNDAQAALKAFQDKLKAELQLRGDGQAEIIANAFIDSQRGKDPDITNGSAASTLVDKITGENGQTMDPKTRDAIIETLNDPKTRDSTLDRFLERVHGNHDILQEYKKHPSELLALKDGPGAPAAAVQASPSASAPVPSLPPAPPPPLRPMPDDEFARQQRELAGQIAQEPDFWRARLIHAQMDVLKLKHENNPSPEKIDAAQQQANNFRMRGFQSWDVNRDNGKDEKTGKDNPRGGAVIDVNITDADRADLGKWRAEAQDILKKSPPSPAPVAAAPGSPLEQEKALNNTILGAGSLEEAQRAKNAIEILALRTSTGPKPTPADEKQVAEIVERQNRDLMNLPTASSDRMAALTKLKQGAQASLDQLNAPPAATAAQPASSPAEPSLIPPPGVTQQDIVRQIRQSSLADALAMTPAKDFVTGKDQYVAANQEIWGAKSLDEAEGAVKNRLAAGTLKRYGAPQSEIDAALRAPASGPGSPNAPSGLPLKEQNRKLESMHRDAEDVLARAGVSPQLSAAAPPSSLSPGAAQPASQSASVAPPAQIADAFIARFVQSKVQDHVASLREGERPKAQQAADRFIGDLRREVIAYESAPVTVDTARGLAGAEPTLKKFLEPTEPGKPSVFDDAVAKAQAKGGVTEDQAALGGYRAVLQAREKEQRPDMHKSTIGSDDSLRDTLKREAYASGSRNLSEGERKDLAKALNPYRTADHQATADTLKDATRLDYLMGMGKTAFPSEKFGVLPTMYERVRDDVLDKIAHPPKPRSEAAPAAPANPAQTAAQGAPTAPPPAQPSSSGRGWIGTVVSALGIGTAEAATPPPARATAPIPPPAAAPSPAPATPSPALPAADQAARNKLVNEIAIMFGVLKKDPNAQKILDMAQKDNQFALSIKQVSGFDLRGAGNDPDAYIAQLKDPNITSTEDLESLHTKVKHVVDNPEILAEAAKHPQALISGAELAGGAMQLFHPLKNAHGVTDIVSNMFEGVGSMIHGLKGLGMEWIANILEKIMDFMGPLVSKWTGGSPQMSTGNGGGLPGFFDALTAASPQRTTVPQPYETGRGPGAAPVPPAATGPQRPDPQIATGAGLQ